MTPASMLRGPSLCISVRSLGKSSIQFNEDALQYKKAEFSDERTEEWEEKQRKADCPSRSRIRHFHVMRRASLCPKSASKQAGKQARIKPIKLVKE